MSSPKLYCNIVNMGTVGPWQAQGSRCAWLIEVFNYGQICNINTAVCTAK